MKLRLTKNVGRITIFLYIFLLLSSLFVIRVNAADGTSSAALTPIQQKLQDLKTEIASKAAVIKSEISQKNSNKVYAGVISQVQDTASASAKLITLTTPKGARVVSINDYTVFQDTSGFKKAATIKNFNQGDFIAALGDVDDKQILIAKKIIKTKPPQIAQTNAVWGQIQSVGPAAIFVVNRDNKKLTLSLNTNTDFRVASDEATLKEVVPGNFLVSIGTDPQNNRSAADFIYLINPNGDLKITPVATASATPSTSSGPTASASPKK